MYSRVNILSAKYKWLKSVMIETHFAVSVYIKLSAAVLYWRITSVIDFIVVCAMKLLTLNLPCTVNVISPLWQACFLLWIVLEIWQLIKSLVLIWFCISVWFLWFSTWHACCGYMLHATCCISRWNHTVWQSISVYQSVCHTTCLKVCTLVFYKLHVHCSFTPVDIFHYIQLYTYQSPLPRA